MSTADPRGQYAIHAAPNAQMLELAARNDGWVNFLLTVAAHGIVQMDAVTRHWNGTSWDSPGRDEFAPTSIKRTYVAEDASTHTPLQGTTADPAAIKAFASEPPETGGCNYTVDISQNMNTPLFEMHNASSHTTEFSYGW